jgi:predicted DNA-binding transcriptional regulator AlpA
MSEQSLSAADLVAHPERIADVEPTAVPVLLAQITAVSAALAARLPVDPDGGDSADPAGEPPTDRLLDVRQAASRLGVSPTWIYRRVTRLPFVVRLDRQVRVSATGLERYLRARQGRATYRLT